MAIRNTPFIHSPAPPEEEAERLHPSVLLAIAAAVASAGTSEGDEELMAQTPALLAGARKKLIDTVQNASGGGSPLALPSPCDLVRPLRTPLASAEGFLVHRWLGVRAVARASCAPVVSEIRRFSAVLSG